MSSRSTKTVIRRLLEKILKSVKHISVINIHFFRLMVGLKGVVKIANRKLMRKYILLNAKLAYIICALNAV